MLYQIGTEFIEAKSEREAFLKEAEFLYDTIRFNETIPSINPTTDIFTISQDSAREFFGELMTDIATEYEVDLPVFYDDGEIMLLISESTDFKTYITLRREKFNLYQFNVEIISDSKCSHVALCLVDDLDECLDEINEAIFEAKELFDMVDIRGEEQ